MDLPALTLVEGGVLGHWQSGPVFDPGRPSWFTVNGGLRFGDRTGLSPYLFIAKALRPFRLLPFTCVSSFETRSYFSPYVVADSPAVPAGAKKWYHETCAEFGRAYPELELPCPCWSEYEGHAVLFMNWLAARYPWADGCSNGYEVVIFSRAINDLGIDFTPAEREDIVNFRVAELQGIKGGPRRFVWDEKYVNPTV
jgi:hypothetical protein